MRSTSLCAVLLCASIAAQLPQPPRATDHNPDPRVFETVITATECEIEFVPGHRTPAMAFNGSVPGPTIDAKLGDTLVVHFVNMLPEPASIHWHGVATPSTMDGSQLAHTAVPSSGYRRYEFVLNVAGTFWYHSHHNTNEQIERGLYGALLVRDPKHDTTLSVAAENERVLVLDDIRLTDDRHIARFATDLGEDIVPWQRAEDLANSRIGNHVLVNAREVTVESIPTLNVRSGTAYRLRLINAANGRIFRLDIGEHPSELWAVGSDQGLWNQAEPVQPIDRIVNTLGHHNELISNPDRRRGTTLTPGDRVELVLVPRGEPGDEFYVRSHDLQKGKHIAYRDPQNNLLFGHDHFDGAEQPTRLIRVRIGSGRGPGWQPKPSLRHDPLQRLEVPSNAAPMASFFGHSLPNIVNGNVMFFLQVNKARELLADVHAREPVEPIDYAPRPMMMQRAQDGFRVRVGSTRVWEVVNFTGNDHNFHLHGFRFQHLDTEFIDLDEPENNGSEEPLRLTWEDTLRIPKRKGLALGRSYTIVRLAVRFDDADLPPELRRSTADLLASGMTPGATRSGGWLVHCHFLEHAARGMMSFVQVVR